jgi:hypothetical protein
VKTKKRKTDKNGQIAKKLKMVEKENESADGTPVPSTATSSTIASQAEGQTRISMPI